jgi:Uma2 family endonuclease
VRPRVARRRRRRRPRALHDAGQAFPPYLIYAWIMVQTASAEALPLPPMSLEEWAGMDEDEPGELVDGHLVEEEVPTNLHEAVVAWLIWALRTWAAPRRGWVFGSEHKLGITPKRGRKPDVSMYLPGTRLSAKASLSRKPPAVVVEVITPTPRDIRRDRVDKLREYAKFGVRDYWLVDPQGQLIEVFELGLDGRYTVALTASEGTIELPGFEGLKLDLDELWAETGRLAIEDEDDSDAGDTEG